jgi:hypothetical protein
MQTVGRWALLVSSTLLLSCQGYYVQYTKDLQLTTDIAIRANGQFNVTKALDTSNFSDIVKQIPRDAIISSVYIAELDASAVALPTTNASYMEFQIYIGDLEGKTALYPVTTRKQITFGTNAVLNVTLQEGSQAIFDQLRTKLNDALKGQSTLPTVRVNVTGQAYAPAGGPGRADVDMKVKVGVKVTYKVCENLSNPAFAGQVSDCTVS